MRQFPSLLMSYDKLGKRIRPLFKRSQHVMRYLGQGVPRFRRSFADLYIPCVFLFDDWKQYRNS